MIPLALALIGVLAAGAPLASLRRLRAHAQGDAEAQSLRPQLVRYLCRIISAVALCLSAATVAYLSRDQHGLVMWVQFGVGAAGGILTVDVLLRRPDPVSGVTSPTRGIRLALYIYAVVLVVVATALKLAVVRLEAISR